MGDDKPGEISESTRSAEREEASAPHTADRPPTPDEDAAASDEILEEGVAEHYRDMTDRGVAQRGEGRID
jgi:hypothetical protein